MKIAHRLALVSIIVALVFFSSCGVANDENNDDLKVDYFYVKFTDYIINMTVPSDTVGVENFSMDAIHLQDYFSIIDKRLQITRFRPDFNPSDTLRITAEGDTIRRNNWALVYKFHLSKNISFSKIEQKADSEPLIEWVDPPLFIKFLDD